MIRDHDGDPIEARDVLDERELVEYAAAQRLKPRSRTPRAPAPGHRCDEYGYDRDGNYHPEHDGIDWWERR